MRFLDVIQENRDISYFILLSTCEIVEAYEITINTLYICLTYIYIYKLC